MVLCLWIGVNPKPWIDTIANDVRAVVKLYPQAEVAKTEVAASLDSSEPSVTVKREQAIEVP